MSNRLNFSSKRLAILNTIKDADCHPGAKWVYNKLKVRYPDLSLGTVYRNIALFKEEGIIVSVGNVNGEERFDGTLSPHAHFICSECNTIYDLFNRELTAMDDILNKQGFTVEGKSVTYYGKCNKCS